MRVSIVQVHLTLRATEPLSGIGVKSFLIILVYNYYYLKNYEHLIIINYIYVTHPMINIVTHLKPKNQKPIPASLILISLLPQYSVQYVLGIWNVFSTIAHAAIWYRLQAIKQAPSYFTFNSLQQRRFEPFVATVATQPWSRDVKRRFFFQIKSSLFFNWIKED